MNNDSQQPHATISTTLAKEAPPTPAPAPLPYDSRPEFARGVLPPPPPMHQEARERVRSGKSRSMEQALKEIAAERSEPNVIVSALAKMFSRERTLIAQRDEAAAKLREVEKQIAAEHNAVVSLLMQRDQLRTEAEKARQRLQEKRHKRDRVADRLKRAESELSRYLDRQAAIDWSHTNTLGAPVCALRLAMAEMETQVARAQAEHDGASKALSVFEAENRAALEVVAR